MWAFCGGMLRAGSTLQYQIVAHIVEYAGIGRRAEFVPPDAFPELREHYASESGRVVFKSHTCTEEIEKECREGDALVFYVYRDLRDVAVSLMHKNNVSVDELLRKGVLDGCLREYGKWTALPGVLVMSYEELTNDLPGAVGRIASHLGVELGKAQCRDIAAEYAPDAQKQRIHKLRSALDQQGEERGFDAQSLLHHNHIRSGKQGQWREELTDAQVAVIESRYGEWLVRHGYRLDEGAPSRDTVRLFSQKGEDFVLWEFFDYKPDGLFVDVGAFDGVHLSNSLSFELGGWRGVCVEPHPDYFEHCRTARPGSICVNAACVSDPAVNEVTFRVEPLGLLSGIAADHDDVAARYAKRGLEFKGFQEVTVPAATLTEILERHLPNGNDVDFMSIDVEGTEIEALKGLDLDRFSPRVLVIEANSEKAEHELIEHLTPFGYTMARALGPNRFFVRNGDDAQRMAAIRMDCVIERNLHPLGEEFTLKTSREPQVIHEGSRSAGRQGSRKGPLRILRRLLGGK